MSLQTAHAALKGHLAALFSDASGSVLTAGPWSERLKGGQTTREHWVLRKVKRKGLQGMGFESPSA
jgi:hypothetical protein